MQGTEFETDEMLKLLTEALRRGPGSPEWHEAVERLRDSGAKDADDYRLLLMVRERLESGQSYREVRAGPAFTRELMQRIDDESENASTKQRTIVAVSIVCVVLVVSSVAILVTMLSNNQPRDTATQQLGQQLFMSPIQSFTFDGGMPAGLTVTGDLKLDVSNGVHASRGSKRGSASLMAAEPVDLVGGACVEVQVRFNPGSDSILTLSVSDANAESGAVPFSVALIDSGFRLNTNGKPEVIPRSLPAGAYTLRIKASDSVAIVEVDGQTLWSGSHHFHSPVVVGVNFALDGKHSDGTRLQSLRILKP